MRIIVIIPARYASTRFPGKALKKLSIGGGRYKSLIQLSWESANKIKSVKDIFIATEDTIPAELEKEFVEWFASYKKSWFDYHDIKDWNNKLEYSAPLLATTDYKHKMNHLKFSRIII